VRNTIGSMSAFPLEQTFVSAGGMSAKCQQETLPQKAARAALRIAALGINSVSAAQGNSIVPLYLPPDSSSVRSSFM
jgi:hypothetical protein